MNSSSKLGGMVPPELLEKFRDAEEHFPEMPNTLNEGLETLEEDIPLELIEEMRAQNAAQEHVISKSGRRTLSGGRYRYRLKWFEYTALGDAWHQRCDILEHFVRATGSKLISTTPSPRVLVTIVDTSHR